jgi:hypothetical protein
MGNLLLEGARFIAKSDVFMEITEGGCVCLRIRICGILVGFNRILNAYRLCYVASKILLNPTKIPQILILKNLLTHHNLLRRRQAFIVHEVKQIHTACPRAYIKLYFVHSTFYIDLVHR